MSRARVVRSSITPAINRTYPSGVLCALLLSVALFSPCLAADPNEPNDLPANATPVAYGYESSETEIGPEGDVDFYRFSGRAGDVVDIRTHNSSLEELDGRIWLLDGNGTVLADNDDDAGFRSSRLTVILPGDGDYLIRYAYRFDTPAREMRSEDPGAGPASERQSGGLHRPGNASGQFDSQNAAEPSAAIDPVGAYILNLDVLAAPPAERLIAGSGFAGVVPLGWSQPEVTILSGAPIVVGVERSANGGADFEYLGTVEEARYLDDPIGEIGTELHYRIRTDYPDGAGSSWSAVVPATPTEAGFQLSSGYTQTPPSIDGSITAGEWSQAVQVRLVDENSGGETATLYVMTDEDYLYLATDRNARVAEIGIYFDPNNDDSFGSSGQEGNYWVDREGTVTFRAIKGAYPDHEFGDSESSPSGVTAEMTVLPFRSQYEVRFDLKTSRLRASVGDVVGIYVYDLVDSDFAGYPPGPGDMIFVAPRTFADLTLAGPTAEIYLPVTEIDFMDTAVGLERTRPLAIENRGIAPLEITGLELIGDDTGSFEARTSLPIVIQPQGAGQVMLAFVPLAHGEVEAILRIRSNDPAGVSEVALNGISVNQPPLLQVRNPVSHGVAGQSLEIEAECTDDLLLASVTGEYSTGSGASGQIVLVQDVGQIYRGAIPGNVLGPEGLQYRIAAVDGEQARSVTSWFDVVVETTRLESPAWAGGSAQNAYRLISIPSLLDDDGAGVFTGSLGPYDAKAWRLFALDGGAYVEQSNRQRIAPGEALWLITRDGAALSTGPGETVPQSEPFRVPLRAGWTLVGNPFAYAVPSEQLSLAGGGVLDLRRYDQSWSSTSSLTPWEGYAVFSETEDELVIRPNSPSALLAGPEVSISARSAAADEAVDSASWEEWTVGIEARCQTARDTDNRAGVRAAARLGRDRFDLAEPPPIGEYVSLYFPRSEWRSVTARFCTDLRAPAADHAYPFHVESNIDDRIRLEFDLRTVPEDAAVWLLDRLTGAVWDLRAEPRIEIGPACTRPRELELLVSGTSSEGAPETGFAGALSASGSMAFPNPARSAVTLLYELPQAQAVSIAIFGVGGELVRTVRDHEEQSKGRHAIVWDGRNDGGTVVPRGSYFYRVAGDSFSARGRILLVE